jgi:hypothetical protein
VTSTTVARLSKNEEAVHVLAARLALLLLDHHQSMRVIEHPMEPAKLLVN